MLDLSDPSGKAAISDDDGHTITLKRPKWRQLEHLRERQVAVSRAITKINIEVNEALAKERERLTDDLPGMSNDELDALTDEERAERGQAADAMMRDRANELDELLATKTHELNERVAETVAGWWRDVLSTLGEDYPNTWPVEDWQEWPFWMLEGMRLVDVTDEEGKIRTVPQGVMADLMQYWRTVPLDRGQMGRPISA